MDSYAVDSHRRIRVVIADDSAPVRKGLSALLSGIGEVEIVGESRDVVETITFIRESRPDVVILDLRMPDGTGLDVLERIRNERPTPKVIVLTNYPFVQYRKKCLEAGASFFFDKSTEFHKIPRAIEQFSTDEARGLKNAMTPEGKQLTRKKGADNHG